MRDIYHQVVMHAPDFRRHSDDALTEASDLCGEAARAISNTLALIGNLTLEASQSEEYSDQNARRDLILLGETLRNLPRLAEALDQNRCTANYVLKQRREVLK